jgi:hypothetical protein
MAKHLPLITRLIRQLSADKVPDARNEALGILRERGHVHKTSAVARCSSDHRRARHEIRDAVGRQVAPGREHD